MVDHRIDRTGLDVIGQETRVEIHADPPPGGKEVFQLPVRQVAGMPAKRPAAGMAGQGRLVRFVEQVVKPGNVQVGHVHGDAQALHFFHGPETIGLQPVRFIQAGGGAQRVLIIPGERRHPDAQGPVLPDLRQAFFKRLAALHGQHEAGFAAHGFRRVVRLDPAVFQQAPVNQEHPLEQGADRFGLRVAAHVHGQHLQADPAPVQPLQAQVTALPRLLRHAEQRVGVRVDEDHYFTSMGCSRMKRSTPSAVVKQRPVTVSAQP